VATETTPTATRAAEIEKVAASTNSTLAAPIRAISIPATGGPTSWPMRPIARSAAFARSMGIAARRARAGIRA
jgi:hypothetical protein